MASQRSQLGDARIGADDGHLGSQAGTASMESQIAFEPADDAAVDFDARSRRSVTSAWAEATLPLHVAPVEDGGAGLRSRMAAR